MDGAAELVEDRAREAGLSVERGTVPFPLWRLKGYAEPPSDDPLGPRSRRALVRRGVLVATGQEPTLRLIQEAPPELSSQPSRMWGRGACAGSGRRTEKAVSTNLAIRSTALFTIRWPFSADPAVASPIVPFGV